MVTNDGSTPSEDVDDVANGIGVVVSDFVEPAVKIFFFIFLHLQNKKNFDFESGVNDFKTDFLCISNLQGIKDNFAFYYDNRTL